MSPQHAMSESDPRIELFKWTLSLVVPAVSVLSGIVIGAWLTTRRERKQRRLNFVEKQLQDFYSPMLGIRNEIRMRSELRVRIQDASNVEWAKLCARADKSVAGLRDLEGARSAEFAKLIEYDNDQLERELVPAYRQMAKLFRDKYFLAGYDTRSHYGQLIEYVELWDRWAAKSIPPEVTMNLGHTEAKLSGFYEHLQEKHDSLRKKLEDGFA